METNSPAAQPPPASEMENRPLGITEEQLANFLSAAFADHPGWVVRSRESIPSFQQYMERILVTWKEASVPSAIRDETVFLRIYRGLMSWWTMVTPDLPLREQTAWRVADSAGVPVPDTLWTKDTPELSVAVQRLSPGQNLRELTMTDGLEAGLGKMLARIHSARLEATDQRHLPDITLPSLFPRLRSWAREAKVDVMAQTVEWLQERFLNEVVEQPAVFLHGDFHGGNVLVAGEEVTAVIDWEEAAYGDPRLDLCVMERVLRLRFNGAGQVFLAAYEEASGIKPGDLEPWNQLCGIRSQIVGAWVKDRITRGDSLPTARPEAWYC